MVNLCRDEVTHTLKHKIDQVGCGLTPQRGSA